MVTPARNGASHRDTFNERPAPTAPQTAKGSRLANVTSGRIVRPWTVVLYGTDGVGKSSFAAAAPKPIFIGAEEGTDQLDVARMPKVHGWQDILDSADELITGQHDYKTLVLDTANWAEPLLWAELCRRHGKTDIEDFGYGKGYVAALQGWRVLLEKFDRVRARGLNVMILAHSIVNTFKNPAVDADFDRYELALCKAKNGDAAGLLRQWAECVLFASYEQWTKKVDGRAKGIGKGARVLYTERRPTWDAKNRFNLPEELPLDFNAFWDAVEEQRPADAAALKARIATMLTQVDEVVQAKVTKALADAGDNPEAIKKVANRLSATIYQNAAPTEG